MKKSHGIWKPTAILLSLIAAADLLGRLFSPTASIGTWAGSLGLSVTAIGVVQYAFGAPRLPRILWRVFGPPFSIVMIWPLASSVGWLATRLAIKSLSVAEQATTAGLLVLLALYGTVIVVPLYRLGEWRRLSGEPDKHVTELADTFV